MPAKTKLALPARTEQDMRVTWASETKAVCKVVRRSKKKPKRIRSVRALKRGRCRLVASAPGSDSYEPLDASFTIRAV